MRIYLLDGETIEYTKDDYTNYVYDGKFFIVIYHDQWIGLYNLDAIQYVDIDKDY